MNNIFDVIVYVFDWLRTTEFVPLSINDFSVTFTLLEILLMPIFASLTIFVVKHIINLVN